MKKRFKFSLIAFIAAGFLPALSVFAQNNTDISLFLKSDSSKYLPEVISETGDMYNLVGHHGPAVENEWVAYRIFFNHSTSIDVYSKTKPGLELKKFRWYPTVEQQESGWGVDMYKVGNTVGLGGVQLWDGEKLVPPDPVTSRIASVGKEGSSSWMEMVSEGIPYKGSTVDIKVKVTVFSGKREALVEAEELNGKKVQFATGINYHKGNKVVNKKNYITVWGIHPEDVAAVPVDMGAAIIFNPEDFSKKLDDGNQILLITHPANKVSTYITSSNMNEQELNTDKKFNKYVKNLKFSF